ncbi:unnamed protein product, partial [Mycena citricolor]
IHDYIPLSLLMSSIIDTKQFQRLREIKQLGTSYLVWPGASHNRFEHCLGVGHLARCMVEHLRKSQPELRITDRDVNMVQIAGLCHDLGHGPWSHVWDGQFIPAVAPEKKWQHEDASKMMFRALVQKNPVQISSEADIQFVMALIDGDPSLCSPDEKRFLFDIVANKRNGLDVDKFDYIARDSYMIGEACTISFQRHVILPVLCHAFLIPRSLINSARVINDEICYDIKDINQLYEIFYTRFKLHKTIYNHKTASSIECMIVDALKLAEPYMKIAERIENPDKFLYLTDHIMSRIESDDDPVLGAARDLFARIKQRDLYKFVDQRVIEWEHRHIFKEAVTPARIVEEARKIAEAAGNTDHLHLLTEETVIVRHSTMHYGMKDRNPLDFVRFYSKRVPNISAHAQKHDYSMLMPRIFAEVYMTIFTRVPQLMAVVQAGYRELLLELPQDTPPVTPKVKAKSLSPHSSFNTIPMQFVPSTPSRDRTLKRPRDEDGDEEERALKRKAQAK